LASVWCSSSLSLAESSRAGFSLVVVGHDDRCRCWRAGQSCRFPGERLGAWLMLGAFVVGFVLVGATVVLSTLVIYRFAFVDDLFVESV
jgi:hypothetical protein